MTVASPTAPSDWRRPTRHRLGWSSPPTELVLRRSTRVGSEVRFSINRRFLARALSLGFPEVEIQDAQQPVVCRNYVSWSAINLYQSCPLWYYFRYVAGLPERTVSASLVFGPAIHRAVEHRFTELLAGNEPPSIEALAGEYDRHWSEIDTATVQFGKGDDRESLNELARRMLAAFQGSRLAQPGGHVIGVGETLRGPLVAGVSDVLGRVDLLVESTDKWVLPDLKTSRSRWSAEQVEDAGAQLLLYSDLMHQLAPDKRLRLRFGVITKSKEPTVDGHRSHRHHHHSLESSGWVTASSRLFHLCLSLHSTTQKPGRRLLVVEDTPPDEEGREHASLVQVARRCLVRPFPTRRPVEPSRFGEVDAVDSWRGCGPTTSSGG